MKRGPLLIAIVASLAVVAAVTWPAFRIRSSFESGQESARSDFSELRRQAINTISLPEDAAEEPWRAKARIAWASQRGLLAVVVKDASGEVVYAKPSSSPYYRRTPDGLSFESPDGTTARYKGPLASGLSIEALYVTLTQEDVFYPIRDAAIILAALLAIVGAGLLVSSGARPRGRRAGAVHEPLPEASLAGTPERGAAGIQEAAPATPAAIPVAASPFPREEHSLYHEDAFERDRTPEVVPATAPIAPPDVDAAVAPPERADRPGFVKAGDLPEGAFDAESGLGWEAYLRERLSAELRRSASFEQDLALLLTSFNGPGRGEADFNLYASIVRDFFSFKDMAFLFGDDGTASILPNMDVDHALRMCEELRKKVSEAFPGKPESALPFFGLSSRAGRLVDADRIIGEAMAALNKARKDGGSSILAFRPDPERFRAYLANG